MSKKPRGGNPANRTSGRVTPKGTAPKPPAGSGKVRDAAHRARVTGRPSSAARITPKARTNRSLLAAVLYELEQRP